MKRNAVEKLKALVVRNPEIAEYLKRIHDRWADYKAKVKCKDGSDPKWVNDFEYNCNGKREKVFGLEGWEFGVPHWLMRVLHDRGLVEILYKSRSSTHYGVYDETMEAIEDVVSMGVESIAEEVEEKPVAKPTREIFNDIVGLDDVKDLIIDVLTSDKPVHLLLVGPPASAKTMILEAISRHYNVQILLAGASTRAGLRDYIIENKPEIMLIDELDKIENSLDLSVLLSWMESQRLIVTMATKKAYVKCPSVCKVIATANTTKRIPPELLSRFIVVNIKPYTDEEVKAICINVLKNRENLEEKLAEKIADAVVKKIKSKDPRDCVKIGRLAKNPEDVDRIVEILSKRK
jgi:Holliday junction DNA helicase RuvB